MAQHIPISCFKQKTFKKIEESIKKDFFGCYLPTCSMKYELLERTIGENAIKDYQENENDKVFLTNRYIGKGIIYGDTRGGFEIHYDTKKKELINIYLVA